MNKFTETLYKKVGRKYVPVSAHWSDHNGDQMAVGTFRLTYAYEDGARRYEYEVKPDTASFIAASMIAKIAMEKEITNASKMRASGEWSKAQIATIDEFREKMGGMFPSWWNEQSAHNISDAAIRAVMEFKS